MIGLCMLSQNHGSKRRKKGSANPQIKILNGSKHKHKLRKIKLSLHHLASFFYSPRKREVQVRLKKEYMKIYCLSWIIWYVYTFSHFFGNCLNNTQHKLYRDGHQSVYVFELLHLLSVWIMINANANLLILDKNRFRL